MVLAVRFQKPAPPGHDHPALFEELGLVGISGPYVVAFLVTHLPFDGCLRPQSGLDQRAARHGAKAVAADVHSGVIAHRPRRSITVFSDIDFQGLASPANTRSNLPVILWICSSKVTACGDEDTR